MTRSPFTIPVTRNGQKTPLPVIFCTKDEITDYFSSLPHEHLLSWTFLLLGFACGAQSKIDELEKIQNDFPAYHERPL